MMSRLETLVLNAYTQALLIAREKGLRGNEARDVAIEVVCTVVSRKMGQPISVEVVEGIVDDRDSSRLDPF